MLGNRSHAAYAGDQPLPAVIKCSKLSWFGHVSRHNSLSRIILQGTVKKKGIKDGRQHKELDRSHPHVTDT